MKQHKFISVVIRCHNAEKRIPHFLAAVDDHFDERFDAYEIVVVDDASRDGSTEVVKTVAPTLHCALSVVELAHFHGVEAAMVAGLDRAMGDFVFEFDDTFMDYPLEVLDRMYDSAVERVRHRRCRPDNLGWGLRAFYAVCNWFSGIQPPSATSGCGCRRAALSTRCSTSGSGSETGRSSTARPGTGTCDWTTGRPVGRPPSADEPAFGLDVFFSFTDAGSGSRGRSSCSSRRCRPCRSCEHHRVRERQGDAVGADDYVDLAVGFAGLYFVLAVLGEYVARILAEVRSRPIYTMDKTLTWTITPTETERVPRHPGEGAGRGAATSRSRSWCASGESPPSTSGEAERAELGARADEPDRYLVTWPSPAPDVIVQGLLALVPEEDVVTIGRHDDDTVRLDLAGEFDVLPCRSTSNGTCWPSGLLFPKTLGQQDFEETARSLAVNLTSVVRICEHLLTDNPRARIAIVSSESSRGSYDTTSSWRRWRSTPTWRDACGAPGAAAGGGVADDHHGQRDDPAAR